MRPVRFILNSELIEFDLDREDQTVLDFLREERALRGTKEGCAEGDCGACTILVGRIENGKLGYKSLNACIAFLPQIDATHVVTVEALSEKGQLHPVQQALVDAHGTQCGFCTPGIVMSLYAMWMNHPNPRRENIELALQGNLCRCTGYASIIRGVETNLSQNSVSNDPLFAHREEVIEQLKSIDIEDDQVGESLFLPPSIEALENRLQELPGARLVAGATDVGLWVTKKFRDISPTIFLTHVEPLKDIEFLDNQVRIGAMASISEAQNALESSFPELVEFWIKFAGQQIRNSGTVGGNIANGSPIGDLPPVLIAMEAKLTLNYFGARRTIPIEDFFIDYGKQDIRKGEFLEWITIPYLQNKTFSFEKISKRPYEDISSVLGVASIELDGGKIVGARIAFGGMAAIPQRAYLTEKAMIGKDMEKGTIIDAMGELEKDFTPISDMRASSIYRMKTAKYFLRSLLEI